jgi:hypothetical protein
MFGDEVTKICCCSSSSCHRDMSYLRNRTFNRDIVRIFRFHDIKAYGFDMANDMARRRTYGFLDQIKRSIRSMRGTCVDHCRADTPDDVPSTYNYNT